MRPTSSAGATRCRAVYADHDDSPGPRPGIAPNRATISAASRARASWSSAASASASRSRKLLQGLRVVADTALVGGRPGPVVLAIARAVAPVERAATPSPTSRGKYRSKRASKVGRCACRLTSVAAYAVLHGAAIGPLRGR